MNQAAGLQSSAGAFLVAALAPAPLGDAFANAADKFSITLTERIRAVLVPDALWRQLDFVVLKHVHHQAVLGHLGRALKQLRFCHFTFEVLEDKLTEAELLFVVVYVVERPNSTSWLNEGACGPRTEHVRGVTHCTRCFADVLQAFDRQRLLQPFLEERFWRILLVDLVEQTIVAALVH